MTIVEQLTPVLYDELRRVAHRQLRRERAGHTLGTTALVHEAYLKLADQTRASFADRAHFLATAAVAMRRVLVDHARGRAREKRGGARLPVTLDEEIALGTGAVGSCDALLELDDALARLGDVEPRLARVVECRFFGGLTDAETAVALGVTERTVRRDWVKARGWLYQALHS
ncbi:RNA polymerase sigma factor [Gemmatirosa kalamazoonensis]|uniref:RNA polymerase sigma factor n=1 Tax=Gemmatirosa kalamazoonensis TaxID=861299 RepID=W0RDB9_9BACT|nr:ECF-type sigma factor [Gemmatirosa kalamazoonensis]AHG88776.1 RNA polymerase sigma factor [Gemmatirosa kalamazoonensis]